MMLKKVNSITDGKKKAEPSWQFCINPALVQQLYFFLNENIKDDHVLLKSEDGINFLLIPEQVFFKLTTVLN